MRILLVWPAQPHIISPPHMKTIQEGLGNLPPIGLICLATWLHERSEHQAEVLDALLEGMSPEEVARHAVATGAQAVGLSGMTHTWMDCLLVIRAIRAVAPQLPIILGGPQATLFPLESLEHSEVDYVVVGDGEVPLTSLLDRLAQGRQDTEGLPGVLRRGDPVGTRYFHPDMADLPIPDRSLTPWRRYASVVSRRPPTTVVMSSRGCPYRCSFCSTAGGKKFRANPARRVVDELENCVDLGIREFLFFDELFTFDRSRVLEICRQIRERGLDVFWDVRSRVDRVDPEMLRSMAEAGCQRVQYGIESGTERVLGLYTKDITLEQARQAVRWTREAGISTYADFMIGAPGETREEVLEPLRFAHSLDLDFVHFSITMLLPRTPLYAQALRQGLLSRDVWREYVLEPTGDFHPPYWEEVLDASELEAMLRRAIHSFYFSPRFLWRSLTSLRSPGELLRKARAGLKLALGL